VASAIRTALLPLSLLAARPVYGGEEPAYTALRSARPDGRALAVENLLLERDAFRFRFESGTFQFLRPVANRTVGAVFVGEGSLEIRPSTEAERRHLAFVTGSKTLEIFTDSFKSLVLLFTDGTAGEIESRGSAAPGASAEAGRIYEGFSKKQRKDLRSNLQIRLLADVLKPPDSGTGVFLAYVDGNKYPPAIAAMDPTGLDWLFGDLGGESSALAVLDGSEILLWYCSPSRAQAEAGNLPVPQPPARALHYAIDTTIQKNAAIRGTTVILFQPLSENLRVLPIHLLPRLRLREAAFSQGESETWLPVVIIQETEKEDADAAVVFPSPLEKEIVRLRLTYEGKEVLQNVGDGNFLVGARDSWYPNLGVFGEPTSFDLTYRCPKILQVVSVGTLQSERVEGDQRISIWKPQKSIRVAGFNYGKFQRLERSDEEGGVTIEIYTNPGTPDFVREINAILENRPDPGLRHVSVDARGLADSAMADGINTARVGSLYFGPLPDKRIAITQQAQAFFGQSWPSLIYLPFLAALDSTTRFELGFHAASHFVDEVGPHEFGHQWWGHLVGWNSYHDQWISEGFAEFTASLVIHATKGAKKWNEFWERARRTILEKPRGSNIRNDAAGPITQGWRLFTPTSPGAYGAMVYKKGAYVVHMLRMMMRGQGGEGDSRFIGMMKDFTSSYAGKNPSTRDFQTVVERHMVPAMNAAGDGKMDWFFQQWVDGTEIPRYRHKLAVASLGGDQYRITGSVTQEGVSSGFRAVTHLYVESSKGEIAHFGVLPIVGTRTVPVDATIRLPKAPKRALLNAFHDVLARD
jgi:hypothetical protein